MTITTMKMVLLMHCGTGRAYKVVFENQMLVGSAAASCLKGFMETGLNNDRETACETHCGTAAPDYLFYTLIKDGVNYNCQCYDCLPPEG